MAYLCDLAFACFRIKQNHYVFVTNIQRIYIFFSLLKINLAFVSCSICGHSFPRNLCFVHLLNNLAFVRLSVCIWKCTTRHVSYILHSSGEQTTTKNESTLTDTFAYCLVMFRSRNHPLSFVFSIQCLKIPSV